MFGALGACAEREVLPAVTVDASPRVTLAGPPAGVPACLKVPFPILPDRDLTRFDVLRIIGEAEILDAAKTACGLRAVRWIDTVRRDLAR